MLTIGDYQVHMLETGLFALDGGAMFGVVPKNLWNRTNPADEQNRIDMAMNVMLLIHKDGRKILIDNGVGHKYDQKFAAIYRIDHARCRLDQSLAAVGLTKSDISDVILTHLHFDHAGGSTETDASGRVVPAFPNAKYYVQKKHLEWALNPTEKDRASFIKPDFVPLRDFGVLECLDDVDGVFPHVTFFLAHGHSMFQQLPIVSDGRATVMFCGDLFPMSAHVPVPYVMAYDLQPLVTMEEKRKVLAMASEKDWLLFFEHDPKVKLGRIQRNEKGFRLEPV